MVNDFSLSLFLSSISPFLKISKYMFKMKVKKKKKMKVNEDD